ncbi:hypothetical protein V498_10085 [Pseudogymnoascus sp. VKM F-4517 (FW-2822)]|nr:hypothetical protein V498_10085 [Pseudogymnoascus sp. VKM F-4517 (FW-2822)]
MRRPKELTLVIRPLRPDGLNPRRGRQLAAVGVAAGHPQLLDEDGAALDVEAGCAFTVAGGGGEVKARAAATGGAAPVVVGCLEGRDVGAGVAGFVLGDGGGGGAGGCCCQ